MTKALLALLLAFSFSFNVHADAPVYTASVEGDFEQVYQNVHKALENNRLFVVFEPNIGKRLSRLAEKWGENYNRNKLDQFRSMVFCHVWYANEISNKDPSMTALCPLHISLIEKDGVTSINFVRPDVVAKGSDAEPVARELTELVIKAITEGLAASKN